MRDSLFKLLFHLGALRLFRVHEHAVPILCFHRVHPTYDPFTQPLAPDAFARILKGLAGHLTFVSLLDVCQSSDLPKNACVLTFDDALLDFYLYAFPIVERAGIPVTVFVPTESIEHQRELYNYELAAMLLHAHQNNIHIAVPEIGPVANASLVDYLRVAGRFAKSPHRIAEMEDLRRQFTTPLSPLAPPMTWEQLRHLKSAGVDIASHSHAHAWLPSMDEQQIVNDLLTSVQLLKERLEVETHHVAYPMGGMDDKVRHVMNTHQLTGFTTQGNNYQPRADAHEAIPRFNVSDRSFEEILFRVGGFHALVNRD
jgi:peptidoglycan/xylan/chitin deacetylase (PgdA/CDA1 family)